MISYFSPLIRRNPQLKTYALYLTSIPIVQVAGDALPSLAPAMLRLFSDTLPSVAVVVSARRRRLILHDKSPSRCFSLSASLQLLIATIQTLVTPNYDDSNASDAQIATIQTLVTLDHDASAPDCQRRFILHNASGDASSFGDASGYLFFLFFFLLS